MKQLVITLLILFIGLSPTSANAYDQKTFVVDGIAYRTISNSSIQVIPHPDKKYEGEITIPHTVIYNTSKYNVTQIGSRAFYDCDKLTKLTLPGTITDIEEYAFTKCTALEEIMLPESITRTSYGIFDDCYNLRKVILSSKMTIISGCSFVNCTKLKEIIIPYGVREVLMSAFSTCESLEKLEFPASVTEIHPSVAHYCTNLRSITFGLGKNSEMTPVDSRLKLSGIAPQFSHCPNIENVYSLYVNPPQIGTGTPSPTAEPIENPVFDDITFENATLHVPVGSLDAYHNSSMWGKFKDIRETDFAALDTIEEDEDTFIINGLTLNFSHPSISATAYDIAGRKIANTVNGTITFPTRGIYIVKTRTTSHKIAL